MATYRFYLKEGAEGSLISLNTIDSSPLKKDKKGGWFIETCTEVVAVDSDDPFINPSLLKKLEGKIAYITMVVKTNDTSISTSYGYHFLPDGDGEGYVHVGRRRISGYGDDNFFMTDITAWARNWDDMTRLCRSALVEKQQNSTDESSDMLGIKFCCIAWALIMFVAGIATGVAVMY